eukprot:CAMPEP_0172536806 /NCGR_PEP_ID=MMETSP1067-20121228/8523_1 /TAXON_ID=265564 ORGANISM="Thalassiosira punctigera, Strain Tpunct2005C2" /NCGR_SAMPLE_ID=MMETSP1067 /ASSEMBLY_ACC=CAM_ASM_000444 /LENGTH=671 /DNA_ID=CAMNT_0013321969 /DNA_START=186 /DNA_END=2198 /DNA_ORIENTATION=+
MSFAEQLAARAAETHRHQQESHRRLQTRIITAPEDGHLPGSPQTSLPPRPPPPLEEAPLRHKWGGSTPPPPRPGRMLARRNHLGPPSLSLGGKTRNGLGGGSPSPARKLLSPSPGTPGLFAEQLKRSSGSLSKLDEPDGDRDWSSQQPRRKEKSASSDSALSFSSSTHSTEVTPSTPSTLGTPSPLPRKSLLPSNSNKKIYEEEDEYDLVGFSLMDATAGSTADDEDEGDGGEEEGESPVSQKTTEPSSLQRALFRSSNLSPITSKEHEVIDLSSVSSPSSPLSRRESRTDPELRSKLQRQLLKCQTPGSSILQTSQPSSQNELDAIDSANTHVNESAQISVCDDSDDNGIFGAWAQIESLKQRYREAEERARRECERAENASYELSLIKQRAKEQQQESDAEDAATASSTVNDIISEEVVVVVQKEDVMTMIEREEVGDPAPAILEGDSLDASANQQELAPGSEISQDHGADALRWKKRALEAEERLAKEVERLERAAAAAATTAPSQPLAPPSRIEESPDLICLKNAEIGVLRSQIHRLERRVKEECERNDDLLRSSSYLNQHLDHLDRLDGSHPPLVVASECMSTSSNPTPRSADMDELRLLRSEIRNLQYQLRASASHNGTNPTSANSTTGESTLSSLDGDPGEVKGGEVEEDDGNNASSSSSLSVW